MLKGQYEDALQRRIWHYNHALETADSYQRIVRLSTSFIEWAELGRRYPKARQVLIGIRDRDAERFSAGNGYGLSELQPSGVDVVFERRSKPKAFSLV
jgi:hypothetical protein